MFLSNHAAPFITFIKFGLCISAASKAAPVCPELPSATSLYPPTPSPLVQLTPGGFSPLTAALPACHTQLHLFFSGRLRKGQTPLASRVCSRLVCGCRGLSKAAVYPLHKGSWSVFSSNFQRSRFAVFHLLFELY